ncbi:hypothetical protein GCM10009609_09740 [Pseudonocardia aurantiaca]|uniref:Integral membrane protein n=1 Tax=Pseudonocardia aurantiaca TaxID=75290 RepID=A0ABW4FCP2_9PSEU
MSSTNRWSGARGTTVIGLVAGAVGILVLRFSGAAMPSVPPGLVLLVAAAALVAFSTRRWAPIVAVLVALSEILGYVLSGSTYGLFAVDSIGILIGTWVRGIGIVLAFAAGIAATVVGYRRTPSEAH